MAQLCIKQNNIFFLDEEPVKKVNGTASKKPKNEALSTSMITTTDDKTPDNKSAPFRRVHSDKIEIKNPKLRDNSYKNFDTWGAKANKDLIVTQGKSFRHEKTKKKRGSYKGGQINVGVNSIRFGSDSE